MLSLTLMSGFQARSAKFLGAIGLDWELVGVGDLNADGRADILFRRKGDGMVAHLMKGLQVISAHLLGAVGNDWTLAAVADLNGDGTADILFQRARDGMMSILLMNGAQIKGSQLARPDRYGVEPNCCGRYQW